MSQKQPEALTVGLDVGGTKVEGVLLDAAGQMLGTIRLPTTPGSDGVLDSVIAAVHGLTNAAHVRIPDLGGVGIGIPGIVDPVRGSVSHAVNVGIDGVPLALVERGSAALGGVPVTVENDLNVAALGASHAMGLDGADLAFLALGTGVAAGIVLGGQVLRGVSGAAGEIGHVPIDRQGPACACGQVGCIEVFASGSALASRWPARHGGHAPAELFAAAAAGDPVAQAIKNDLADAVACAVRILGLTVDVRHVVLGGGVAGLGASLLDAVRVSLEDQARMSPFLASLNLAKRVSLAPVGVPVAAIGAALVGRGKVPAWKL